MKIFVFLCFLIGMSLCWWEDPVRLPSDGGRLRGSFVDTNNQIYLLREFDKNRIYFLAFNRTEYSYDLWQSFLTGWPLDCERIELIGLQDGLHLMIVCGNGTDIFYSESEDAGKNWTQPINLITNRDTYKRYPGSSLWIPSTGKVYIFYHCYKAGTATQIVYKSRPKASLIFGRETLVFRSFDYADLVPSLRAAFTDFKDGLIIHLFWQRYNEDVKEFVYTNSENTGITWKEPKAFQNPNTNEDLTTVVASFLKGKYTFVFNRNSSSNRIIGQYTANDGLSFSDPEDYGQYVAADPFYAYPWSMAYCSKVEHLFVSIVHGYHGSTSRPTYMIMNTLTGKRYTSTPNFVYYSFGQAMSCYYNTTTGFLNVDLFYSDNSNYLYKMSDRTPLALIHIETSNQ